jgi:hypothetical protein
VKIVPLSQTARARFFALARHHSLQACFLTALLALGSRAPAIPQTFSQPSTITLRTGKPVEEFFRDPTAWAPGAEIPGEAPDSSNHDGSTVTPAGAVFGVNASSIKLVRGSSGELQSTVVAYDAKTAGTTAQKLHERLAANIAAFAGVHGVNAQGQIRFATRELVITLPHDAAANLEVRITRAEPSATARATAQH